MTNLDPDNWNAFLQSNFALRAGILLVAEVGCVSLVGVSVLLAISIRNTIKYSRHRGDSGSPLQPVSLLFLMAMLMDSIQAIGNILCVRWAFDGKVTEGPYCTTQAVIKQIGEGGVSWFTTSVAIMTFVQTMFPGKLNPSQAHRLAVAMIVWTFLFLFLIIIIPATTIPHYYGDAGAWCWITYTSGEVSRLKIGSEYGYLWLAATVSFVLYGIIVVNWLREATMKRDHRRHREAISMAWYPIAYTAEVFPISLVRFLEWNSKGPRPQRGFLILAAILFASSGAINVLLWLLTGRRFGFSDPHEGDERDKEEDPRRESYMTYMVSSVPGRMLSPVSGGMVSPGRRGLHFRAATAGGEWHFSQPSFPEDPPVVHRGYITEPYEWMPPREGEPGP